MGSTFPWLHSSQDWLEAEILATFDRLSFSPVSDQHRTFQCQGTWDIIVDPEIVLAPAGKRPFRQDAADSIVAALRDGLALPPIELTEVAASPKTPHSRWRLHDGFHRFHLARAMGIVEIPGIWMEPFHDPSLPGFATFRRKNIDR
jgi:hypothetical protein